MATGPEVEETKLMGVVVTCRVEAWGKTVEDLLLMALKEAAKFFGVPLTKLAVYEMEAHPRNWNRQEDGTVLEWEADVRVHMAKNHG